MKKILWKALFTLLIVSSLLPAKAQTLESTDQYFEIAKNLDILGNLYRELYQNYVDEIEPAKLIRTGIDEMLESLDPYTNFISAGQIEEYRFISTGKYAGIGAAIGKRDGGIIITDPYEGYPAQKAGLRAGDRLIKIDEENIAAENYNTSNVADLLRGQPQTKVKLTIQRPGEATTRVIEVIRDQIKIKNVPYAGMVNEKIGYIALTGFTENASQEVRTALQNLKKENPKMEGLILDLRGNPGGLLFESIKISNLFVPKGEKIVETRGKKKDSEQQYYASEAPLDIQIPIVVLINSGSASASEIVSGVIQDLDRGVIMGRRSFGKGLVQTTRPLSYNTQLKVTIAKYYTPSGRCIQAIDYANRNPDGSVGKIADSLKKEFKTKAGRPVFDGGGIEPDIAIEEEELHTITQELVRQGIIFDFATKFRNENEKIASAKTFQVSEDIYADFVSFVRGKDFSFETKTEKELAKLTKLMEEEAYKDDMQEELSSLQDKLAEEKKNDIYNFRGEIEKILKVEIISRYYYQSGQVEGSFDIDKDILEAAKILQNKEKYQQILTQP